jgi:hypothetical protein
VIYLGVALLGVITAVMVRGAFHICSARLTDTID